MRAKSLVSLSLSTFAPSKLLGDLVDLVGIEPTTSSMPFNPD